jgi:predicted MFS family arabinose efflux permease
MAELFSFMREYRGIEKPVLNVIIAEFFIQLVNATFMVILPLYLDRMGYDNEQIALFITFRFLGVFILALPLGKFIRGKKIMSLFYLSSFCVPFFGLCIVIAVISKIKLLIYAALLLWGASFTFMQIPVSPFILRNSHPQNHTAAISLSYSTWSFGGILSGLLIGALDWINPVIFNEQFILILFSVMSFGGLFFLFRIKNFKEQSHDENDKGVKVQKTEWNLIVKALVPTLIIATGAGLTIPFISLFFDEVHGLHKGGFSVLSSIAAVLVAYGALLVPKIKRSIGYKIAIPTTQSLAVVSLVAMATTQFYNQYSVAVIIAGACYLLRQPLMNMAGPMTTEVVLKYVGAGNREITSALTSAIWSGSWVLSGYMVSIMFSQGYHFVNIFLITSLLYAFGIVMYYLLILDYNIRQEKGLIEDD